MPIKCFVDKILCTNDSNLKSVYFEKFHVSHINIFWKQLILAHQTHHLGYQFSVSQFSGKFCQIHIFTKNLYKSTIISLSENLLRQYTSLKFLLFIWTWEKSFSSRLFAWLPISQHLRKLKNDCCDNVWHRMTWIYELCHYCTQW